MVGASELSRWKKETTAFCIVMSLLVLFDGAVIAARIYVRTAMIKGSLGWDDALLCLSYALFTAVCLMAMVDLEMVPSSVVYGMNSVPVSEFWLHEVKQVLFYVSSGFAKTAAALVLLRLTPDRSIRWLLIGSIGTVVIWTIVSTIATFVWCYYSDSDSLDACRSSVYFRAVFNIIIDYFYALLPVFMLRNTQMPLRLKIGALVLLCMGLFASTATVIRLVLLITMPTTGAEHQILLFILWTNVEVGLSIFAAGATALRPLLRRLPTCWLIKSRPGREGSEAYELESGSQSMRMRWTRNAGPQLDPISTGRFGCS
ncbi:integral membrane protein [Xylariomycetidae sp. FL0641]|nr:integral membrane protein [Xylariomycetidae sp. FL0641]